MTSITAVIREAQVGQNQRPDCPMPSSFLIGNKPTKTAEDEKVYEAFVDIWQKQLAQNWENDYTQMSDEIAADPPFPPEPNMCIGYCSRSCGARVTAVGPHSRRWQHAPALLVLPSLAPFPFTRTQATAAANQQQEDAMLLTGADLKSTPNGHQKTQECDTDKMEAVSILE